LLFSNGVLAHRYGLACKQGFVGEKLVAFQNCGVGGNAIAFGQKNDVTRHDLTARNSLLNAIPHHQCTGACEISQGSEHPFTTRFLHYANRSREGRECGEHDCFKWFANEQIDSAAGKQEREHGLAHDIKSDSD